MVLPQRWTQLRYHPVQTLYYRSPHRFNMVPAGRRSGKTELAKRKLVKRALRGTRFDDAHFFAAAPTRDQAKRIYWADLKKLVPNEYKRRTSEGELTIDLITGASISVVGMDKPERIEGTPWDGGILDEYGNMKEAAWPENIRPALSDRLGWCDFIGVPEGRNHYYALYLKAKDEFAEGGEFSPWAVFEWESKDILDPAEVEAARKDLHPLVFEQEYGGKFVDWSGVAILDVNRWLDDGKNPVEVPTNCDAVFAVIDTALKTGKENDGTGVVFFAVNRLSGRPLVILDWELMQIEAALLESWLPSVFTRLDQFAKDCGARMGSLGAFIEDKNSGTVLLQQAARRQWRATALPEKLTAMGKDERVLLISGFHYTEKVRITASAHAKRTLFKGASANHLLRQVGEFRLADPEAAKRADDLLDCYAYGVAITFGDNKGV